MATFGQIPSNVPFNNFQVVTSSTRPSSPDEGDHIYETDTGFVRLWDGTSWVLTTGAKLPNARVYRDVAQTVPANTFAYVAINTTRWLDDVTLDSGERSLSIIEPGIYTVFGGVEFDANSTGRRIAALEVNGTTEIARDYKLANSGNHTIHISTEWYFQANDFVKLLVWQNSGGNLDIQGVGSNARAGELGVTYKAPPPTVT